jgi:hypothetical protein
VLLEQFLTGYWSARTRANYVFIIGGCCTWCVERAHDAFAIIDVVTRSWIGYLLTAQMTSTQAQLLFARALEDQALLDVATGELLGPDGRPLARDSDATPVLVAWSDNRAGDDLDGHPRVHGLDGHRAAPRTSRHAD